MTIRICGNSHVVALQHGHGEVKDQGPPLSVFPLGGANFDNTDFSYATAEGVRFNVDLFNDLLMRFAGLTHVSTEGLWGFSVGSFFSRIYANSYWRAVAPSAVALPNHRPLTLAQVEAIVAEDQKYVLQFYKHLQQVGTNFFIIIGPPPPANYSAIGNGVPRDTVISLEKIARRWFLAQLDKMGVRYLDVPPETVDESGFLRPEFKLDTKPDGTPDPHHANSAYGALVVQQIFAEIAQREAS